MLGQHLPEDGQNSLSIVCRDLSPSEAGCGLRLAVRSARGGAMFACSSMSHLRVNRSGNRSILPNAEGPSRKLIQAWHPWEQKVQNGLPVGTYGKVLTAPIHCGEVK